MKLELSRRWLSSVLQLLTLAGFHSFCRIYSGIPNAHLRDKQVVFRLLNVWEVYSGVVRFVEDDGFWIESPPLISQISANEAWTPHVKHIQAPIVFVPTSSLMYLIAAQE